jgi:hypothetical protein
LKYFNKDFVPKIIPSKEKIEEFSELISIEMEEDNRETFWLK